MSDYQSRRDVVNVIAQVDEVKGVMEENVRKVIERGENLNKLDDKAKNLENNAGMFAKTTTDARKKFQMKNLKWTIALIACLSLLVLIVVLSIYFSLKR